ncbi:c-type cytochrome [Pseudohoeflea coraliihabitans]|uniref:C-type cytochrome n=1 Tax=Pseudohoeflea coraliihabitans TaxID=2860393 RepID=A0ABS6WRQ3_9HYPH|nr:cytochrome c [Pseudohoeflea sp. DP4N28-3]MBW3097740.1 c-type cytochrome [Pseudohoeflea sp. DP4N28-3]
MKRKSTILFGIAVVGLAAIAVFTQKQVSEAPVDGLSFMGEPVTTDEIARGQEVYAANCASCHGASLGGQPDWKRRLDTGRMPAPPHDESGHTWHHADRDLFTITKLGVGGVVPGYESDMPAYEGVLTDEEIRAVLVFIKSTWPDRERAFQANVTANDQGGS